MSIELKQRHKLALWQLALSDSNSDFSGNLSIEKKDREELIKLGFITSQKAGRKILIEITDKGFLWCNENLLDEFSGRASKPMVPIINSLLKRLSRLFEKSNEVNAIGTFINKTKTQQQAENSTTTEVTSSHVSETKPNQDLEQAISQACLKLNHGISSQRIRISDVKQFLSEFSNQQIDETLIELNQQGRISLSRIDDPQDMKPEDKSAAIHLPSGSERHIIYFESK